LAPRLIGTTIYDDSIAPAFCDIFEIAPKTVEDHYFDWLSATIKKYDVDMIIPGIEIDMITWNKERQRLIKMGASPLLNNAKLIVLCTDKWKFYQKLKAAGSSLAIESRTQGTYDQLEHDLGMPFILKPRSGSASKGFVKIEKREDFLEYQDRFGAELMAQPLVGDDAHEYTVSGFFDKDSKLICHMGLKRKLSNDGFTEKAQVVFLEGVEAALEELAFILKPLGPTNFQFRTDHGNLKLLEINPRISSATSIRTAFGYNECAMSVNYFLFNQLPKKPAIREGRAVRYTEDHIFYDRHSI
jgi:carbamoyl-phosphate synthase large subunit